jgi:bifunctional DNA-binding transcriptional regulator/antitoxin component of YhaV-PrlF toxin-antitoxin module
VIPSPYRKVLGLREGDEVVISLQGNELRIQTNQQALRHAQQLVRQYVPQHRSLAAELVAERRKEARRE